MADDIELEIAIAEEEARARQKQRASTAAPIAAPPPMGFWDEAAGGKQSFLGNVGEIAKNVVYDAPVNAARGLGQLALAGLEKLPNAFDGGSDYTRGVNPFDRSMTVLGEGGARYLGQMAGPTIPIAGPAIHAGIDALTGELQPGGVYGKELREGITSAGSAAILGAIPKVVKGGYQVARDGLFGKPKSVLLQGEAAYPEAYANQLNLGESTIPREKGMTTEFMDRKAAFERLDPMKGVDLADPNGRVQMDKFIGNLQDKAVTTSATRNQILKSAAVAESQKAAAAQAASTPIKIGATIDDLPANIPSQSGTSFGIDRIRLTNPRGAEGIDNALSFINEKFGVSDVTPKGRSLSLSELDDLRQSLDGQLRALGEYDPSVPNSAVNPSDVAAELEVFKHYATQTRELLNKKVSDLLGPDAGAKLASAAQEYDAAINFANLAERFKTETGQAFTTGSAKKVPKGQSILGGKAGMIVDSMVPGRAEAKVVERGLSREGDALRNINALLEINRLGTKPIPRGWALIKGSAPSLAQVENLAIGMGLVGQAGEIASMPDDIAQKVVGAVAAANPQAFESNPDMANVIDDKYQDPMSRDRVVQSSLDLEPRERAMRIGASFTNRYVPPSPPMTPIQPPIPALPATISSLTENLESAFATSRPAQDYSYDQSNGISNLERLTNGNGLE
jgi:hypothetical protein